MITRAIKTEMIASLNDKFGKAKAAFLVDYKGMTVEQVTSLRKKLFPIESEMKVVRNTLALRALANHPGAEAALKDGFTGTNAIIFAYNDATVVAKTLSDFAKDVEQIQLKIGVMDGNKLSVENIKALASLPSKEVLRATLLGVMNAPATKFVQTLNAVPSGFVRVLAAKEKQYQPA